MFLIHGQVWYSEDERAGHLYFSCRILKKNKRWLPVFIAISLGLLLDAIFKQRPGVYWPIKIIYYTFWMKDIENILLVKL